MARYFHQTGRPVVCDIERQDDNATLELLRTCSHVILPESFALSLTGADTADRALPNLRHMLPNASLCLITQGAQGGVFSQQHEPTQAVNHYHPPEIITSCDTSGCGDVFHGAFCVALSRGMPLEKCIGFAASKAAEALHNDDALRF
jgi:sugar/nucleoside kinase (ribokinase family)